MDDKYLDLLIEAVLPKGSKQRIPWRSGKTDLQYAKTDINGVSQECFILNKLKYILQFKPSLMLVIPNMDALKLRNGATNGWLITARKAQQLEYTIIDNGKCEAKTYFFGNKKEGRTLDTVQRFTERGFSIENISGISFLPNNAKIEITTKKSDYSKPSIVVGHQQSAFNPERSKKNTDSKLLVPMRIKRVK